MKSQPKLFWIGIAIYVASFFTAAVAHRWPGSAPARGYSCALGALTLPWGRNNPFGPSGIFEHRMFEYFAVLISGWINLAFLVTAFLIISIKLSRRAMVILRTLIGLMIPFCWVVFHYEQSYPREGHFLWLLGMLLVLFSAKAKDSEPPSLYSAQTQFIGLRAEVLHSKLRYRRSWRTFPVTA